jgi:hypothetical protein
VGTFRVPSRQARGRLASTLLQPEIFLGDEVDGTYDITAWSLPYAYGVEAHSTNSTADGVFEDVPVLREPEAVDSFREAYGWLVLPSFEAAGPLVRYLAEGGRAFALREAFEQDGIAWPAGTLFVPGDEGAGQALRVAGLAGLAHAVSTGTTASGHDLGTGSSITLTAPRVGVLSGSGLSPISVGAVRYLLEVISGIPFDALEAGSISRPGLNEYDVLVLPAGNAADALSSEEEGLKGWLRGGGTLIALGSSARWASTILAEIELRSGDDAEVSDEERRRLGLRTIQERRSDAWDDAVTGIILPLTLDRAHPLAWGAGLGNEAGEVFALHLNDLAFEPAAEHVTIASFAEPLEAVSGFVSDAKLAEIASSTWLSLARVGRGKVILFADDPLFRLMWPANFVMFTNALLFGPRLR